MTKGRQGLSAVRAWVRGSKAWSGRTSDIYLTKHFGFYDILDPLDEVIADKGFNIMEKLLLRNCRLHIPLERGHKQLTKEQILKTKTIANLRIFVEQAIRHLKLFCIRKHELSISLLDKLDDIVTICAVLCNLFKSCYCTI